jgi:hypothetical protein
MVEPFFCRHRIVPTPSPTFRGLFATRTTPTVIYRSDLGAARIS